MNTKKPTARSTSKPSTENPTKAFYDRFNAPCDNKFVRWNSIPLSWSQLTDFERNASDWYKRYVIGGHKKRFSKEMHFGSYVGDRIASDPTFLPEIPRLKHFEYTLETTFAKVPLIVHIDNYEEGILAEFKTGKQPWSHSRASKHRQLDLYVAMLYLVEKIPPEKLKIDLYWAETADDYITDEYGTDDVIKLTGRIEKYTVKKTTKDVLRILAYVVRIRKQMIAYIEESDV